MSSENDLEPTPSDVRTTGAPVAQSNGPPLVVRHLEAARDAIQLARQAFEVYTLFLMNAGYEEQDEIDGWEYVRYLARARMSLLTVSEVLKLPILAQTLRTELCNERGLLNRTYDQGGHDGRMIEPTDLWRVEDWLTTLTRHAGEEVRSSVEDYQLTRLRELLGDTAALMRRRQVVPTRELDVQNVMHDYLKACFPDFTPRPNVAWPTKKFEPDGGIPSLRCAIEFKYVRTSNEVSRSTDQIFADAKGYAGDGQWQRFIVVYYMTAAVEQPSTIEATLKLAKLSAWKVIVIVGNGS